MVRGIVFFPPYLLSTFVHYDDFAYNYFYVILKLLPSFYLVKTDMRFFPPSYCFQSFSIFSSLPIEENMMLFFLKFWASLIWTIYGNPWLIKTFFLLSRCLFIFFFCFPLVRKLYIAIFLVLFHNVLKFIPNFSSLFLRLTDR